MSDWTDDERRTLENMVREYPGWLGWHSRGEAPGAFANGTRITKIMSEPGDAHAVGTLGTVLGSMAAPAEIAVKFHCRFFYFVEWDPKPRVAVGVAGLKIAPAA